MTAALMAETADSAHLELDQGFLLLFQGIAIPGHPGRHFPYVFSSSCRQCGCLLGACCIGFGAWCFCCCFPGS